MRSTAPFGVGVALSAGMAASAAVTGVQLEYNGLVAGRHVWSLYAVSNDVNHVLLNVIAHTVTAGSMSGVEHNDLLGVPGAWSPTQTVIASHRANDSYVTITGLTGASASTNLDPSFGDGLGAAIPGGAGWFLANINSPPLFTGGRIKIMQIATNLTTPLSFTGRLSIGYKANLASTTPLFADNLTYTVVASFDSDGDGVTDSVDCFPLDSAIYQGAPETCANAGTDNDCDGNASEIDANAPDRVQYFRDLDNDSFTLSTGSLFCPGTTNPGFRPQQSSSLDCNDSSAAVFPGAPETCANLGTDNDCDGNASEVDPGAPDLVPYFRDADGDGYTLSTGSLFCPGTTNPGFRPQPSSPPDCNDNSQVVFPGAPETCANRGTDNDCDGSASDVDLNAPDLVSFFTDADGDTFTLATGALFCPGTTNPGFRAQRSSQLDCNDSSAAVYPGAPETCANLGTDNDCDGNASEVDLNAPDLVPYFRDADGDTYTLSTGALFCPGTTNPGFRPEVSAQLDCNDSSAAVYPGAPELCGTPGVDNDCDGNSAEIDPNAADRVQYFRDSDGDTYTLSTGSLFCPGTTNPGFRPQQSSPLDCNDSSAAVYPGAPETCANAGTDNDCDGLATEVDSNAADRVQFYSDSDGDAFTLATGAMFCPGTTNPGFRPQQSSQLDCNDGSAAVYPGAPELCATAGIDNDCDGDPAEATDPTTWYSDFDGDGYGDSSSGTTACNPPGEGWITLPGDGCPQDSGKLAPGACGCGVADTDGDADGVADCNDNCPAAPNPAQEDCDADGYGDDCAGEPDCNGNGLPDSCDIAGGQSNDVDGDGTPDSCQDDCNLNGLPDSYEIDQGLSEDCDRNGLPNECEDGSSKGDTGNMGPVGSGQAAQGVLLGQTDASTAVRVRVEALGDLDGANEFLTLTLNGISAGGELFGLNASECPSTPDAVEFDVPASQWHQIIGASTTVGEVRVRLVASPAVSAAQCSGGSTRVTVVYGGPGYDCNGDDRPDSCQIAAGELADYDSNLVPDCCEGGEPCVVGSYPVQWRAEDGGNGHWYMAVRPFGTVTNWIMARDYATVRGGYLVTVTSAGEQSIIERLFAGRQSCQGDTNGVFLGGRQAPGNAPGIGWSWVSGEPWAFTNWAPTEPNDFSGFGEDYLMLATEDMRWYDIVLGGAYLPCAYSAVVEWSSDCNSDGQVDYGQIVRGDLVDVDGNGVPDICECRADVNRNGTVDGVDLAIVLGAWGTSGTPGSFADVSGNGVVDGTDLAFVLGAWGVCR